MLSLGECFFNVEIASATKALHGGEDTANKDPNRGSVNRTRTAKAPDQELFTRTRTACDRDLKRAATTQKCTPNELWLETTWLQTTGSKRPG